MQSVSHTTKVQTFIDMLIPCIFYLLININLIPNDNGHTSKLLWIKSYNIKKEPIETTKHYWLPKNVIVYYTMWPLFLSLQIIHTLCPLILYARTRYVRPDARSRNLYSILVGAGSVCAYLCSHRPVGNLANVGQTSKILFAATIYTITTV